MDKVLFTAYISLVVQIVAGIISLFGIFIPLDEKNLILREILWLELIVQCVEILFYIWLVMRLKNITYDPAYVRYADWFITTPVMLVTTVYFFEWTHREAVRGAEINRRDFEYLWTIVASNCMMLLAGFLGEINLLYKSVAVVLGTFFLGITFYLLYKKYVSNFVNLVVFTIMLILWGLYGVAFMFSYSIKNQMYNLLDIFSKNIYAIFIFLVILQQSTNMF